MSDLTTQPGAFIQSSAALLQACVRLGDAKDEKALAGVLAVLVAMLDAAGAVVFLLEPQRPAEVATAQALASWWRPGELPHAVPRVPFSAGGGVAAAEALRHQEICIADGDEAAPAEVASLGLGWATPRFILAPVIEGGRLAGVLWVAGRKGGAWPVPAASLAGSIAALIGIIRPEQADHTPARTVAALRLAGVARWAYDPALDRFSWSDTFLADVELDDAEPRPLEAQARLFAPAGRERMQGLVRDAAENGLAGSAALPLVTPRGRLLIVRLQAAPSRAPSGALIGAHGTIQDITDAAFGAAVLRLGAALHEAVLQDRPLDGALRELCAGAARELGLALVCLVQDGAPDAEPVAAGGPDAAAGGHAASDRRNRRGSLSVDVPGEAGPIARLVAFANAVEALGPAVQTALQDLARLLGVGWTLAGLRQRNAQQRIALDHAEDALAITDAQGRYLWVNGAFERQTGWQLADIIGQLPRVLKSGVQGEAFYKQLWSTVTSGQTYVGELTNLRRDGSVYPCRLTIVPHTDAPGRVAGFTAITRDISQLKDVEDRLSYLEHHDPLTGLPNRTLFSRRLAECCEAVREGPFSAAVLVIDLDRFRGINEAYGHEFGDEVLRRLAQRLRQQIRRHDDLARVSSDEFAIIQRRVRDSSAVEALARRLVDVIAQPIEVGGEAIQVSASIGATLLPDDTAPPEEIQRHAELALQQARAMGRNMSCLYSPALGRREVERAAIHEGLHRALERGEFRLMYQPQFDLRDRRLIGAEALIRWQHPQLGLLSPGRFIPVAEDTGLIRPIGDWVMDEACRQMAVWQAAGVQVPRVGVNLSFGQFSHPDLVGQVRQVLERHAVAPSFLELELTESMVAHDAANAFRVVQGLRQLGVLLTLDDFGSGYSALNYLLQFKVDRIKVDRSFVAEVEKNADARAVLRSMVSLARDLDMSVMAEGVETAEQEDFLRHIECVEVQGFRYAEPMPPDRLAALACGG